jgi:DNA-binding CsgD family transcriptional regulator
VIDLRDQLGEATERLYQRVTKLAELAAGEARIALSRIALGVACGAYHDYRSGVPLPKGDLIEALRAVPWPPDLPEPSRAIELEVLLGWYDDGEEEARRWVNELAPPRTAPEAPPAAAAAQQPAPALTPREARMLAWLHGSYEAQQRALQPTEIARALGIDRLTARQILQQLARKGAAMHAGRRRGWLPRVETP